MSFWRCHGGIPWEIRSHPPNSSLAALSFAGWALKPLAGPKPLAIFDPQDEADAVPSVVEKGETYKLDHGDTCRVNASTGKWELLEHAYDPDFYRKNYAEKDGVVLRRGREGELFPSRREFSEAFEGFKSPRAPA